MGRRRMRQLELFDSYEEHDDEEEEPEMAVRHCEACGASDEYPDDGTVYACTMCRQPVAAGR